MRKFLISLQFSFKMLLLQKYSRQDWKPNWHLKPTSLWLIGGWRHQHRDHLIKHHHAPFRCHHQTDFRFILNFKHGSLFIVSSCNVIFYYYSFYVIWNNWTSTYLQTRETQKTVMVFNDVKYSVFLVGLHSVWYNGS